MAAASKLKTQANNCLNMASNIGCEINDNKSLPQLSWADTLTDFLKHVQISEKPLCKTNYTQTKISQFKLDVPKETTTTEARKLIRTEKFRNLNDRKQNKILELKIQEFKESLEKERYYCKLGLDSEDFSKKRVKKENKLEFKKPQPIKLPTPNIPLSNKEPKGSIKEISVERLTLSTVIDKNEIKKTKIGTNQQLVTSKEEIKELQSFKKKEVIANEYYNREKRVKNNPRLKNKYTIKGKNLFISNYVANKKKQYYFSKWKLFVLSQRNKRDEERKWREKINNFMQRLQDRSQLQAISSNQVTSEKNKKVSQNIKVKNLRKQLTENKDCKEYRQLKMIEERKDTDLEKISQETNKSRQETQHHLRPASVKSLHPDLKGKAKLIRLITAKENGNETIEISEYKDYPNPDILLTMDQKHKERKIRLEEIQEKKRILEEEKDKLAKEKYEQQLLEAELEKKKKLKEFRDKLRKEQMEQEKRKQEWKRLKDLYEKAVNHYNNKRKKHVMDIWCRLLQERRRKNEAAVTYNEYRIQKLIFIAWQVAIHNIENEKSIKAFALRARHLKMRSLLKWRELIIKRRFQYQVAEDWNDYLLVRTTLQAWLHFIYIEQKSQDEMWDVAIAHYDRKLKSKILQHWMLLPQIIYLEREKEYRKKEWRAKVQQVLPDFRPIISAQY